MEHVFQLITSVFIFSIVLAMASDGTLFWLKLVTGIYLFVLLVFMVFVLNAKQKIK